MEYMCICLGYVHRWTQVPMVSRGGWSGTGVIGSWWATNEVLGTDLVSSARTVPVFNHSATSPAPEEIV